MSLGIKSKQSGVNSFIDSGSNIKTVSISTIDTSTSVLFVSWRVPTSDPGIGQLEAYLSSPSQITFKVGASFINTVTVSWEVIEFGGDVYVQHIRDNTSLGDGSTTSCNSVSVNNSFVLSTLSNDGITFGADDAFFPELTSSTLITHRGTEVSTDEIALQVIEMDDINTQIVNAQNQTNEQVDISISSIVESRSFPVHGMRLDGAFGFNSLYTAEFTSSTNIKHLRGIGTGSQVDLYDYIIELPATFITQWDWVSISFSSASVSLTFTNFTESLSFVNLGSLYNTVIRTNEIGDDYNKSFISAEITSSTSVSLTRAGTGEDGACLGWIIEGVDYTEAVSFHKSIYRGLQEGIYKGVG